MAVMDATAGQLFAPQSYIEAVLGPAATGPARP